MKKLPFFKFRTLDWLVETRSLSAKAKGCWIDLLCLMWNGPERGVWTGTFDEFSIVTAIPKEDIPSVTQALRKVATVTDRNDGVTFICEWMVKQESHYNNNAKRQATFRRNMNSNAIITQQTLDVRRKTLDVKTTSNISNTAFERVWLRYPKRLGKKAALRHFAASVQTPEDQQKFERALENYLRFVRGKEIRFVQNGSTWFNNWADWVDYREESNAPNGGTPIAIQVARRQREIEGQRDRPLASAGEILNRIGNLPDVQPKT